MTSASWQGQSDRKRDSPDRLIEIATVLLLAVATMGSAWCAFQVSQWNGEETEAARESATYRIAGSREYALATQIVAYDAAIVSQYAEAVVEGNERLQTFLRTSVVRPGFLPLLEEWQTIIDETGEAPPNLLQNDEYLTELFAESASYDERAEAATLRADEAGRNSDDYIITTLLTASALFFAGVTASFKSRFTRIVLLIASATILAVAAVRLGTYPIA